MKPKLPTKAEWTEAGFSVPKELCSSLAEEYVSLRDHADQGEILATFTPGPWRIGDGGYTVFGPPSAHPAPVTVAMLLPATSRVGKSERDANARLVAAAPMLLQALQNMVQAFDDTDNNWQIVEARAAIAKATRG